jgi:hypothetical protein
MGCGWQAWWSRGVSQNTQQRASRSRLHRQLQPVDVHHGILHGW